MARARSVDQMVIVREHSGNETRCTGAQGPPASLRRTTSAGFAAMRWLADLFHERGVEQHLPEPPGCRVALRHEDEGRPSLRTA